jgi:hypothetical protein
MKKPLLLLITISLSINIFSQNLNLDNIVELKMSNTDKIVKVMTAKNWELFEFEKGKYISYFYQVDENIKAIITFYKNSIKDGIASTLLITYSKEKFNTYKQRLISLDGSLEKIYLEEGNKVEEYKLKIWTIRFKVNNDDKVPLYEVFIE